MGMRVIITGATGMVGEGVLFECLQNPHVSEVLMLNRRPYQMQHPKLTELIVPSFLDLHDHVADLNGYDACFYCAGVCSAGMSEAQYTQITFDITMAFADSLLLLNKQMVFCFISSVFADSTERGRCMWARVKGQTENGLMRLPFKGEYNFRPGGMIMFDEQKNGKRGYKTAMKLLPFLIPKLMVTMQDLGRAMIHAAWCGYSKRVLEIRDIRQLATSLPTSALPSETRNN